MLKQTVTDRKLSNEGALHYSSSLDKASLIGDLHERGVAFRQSENTDELRRKLDDELAGTQRKQRASHHENCSANITMQWFVIRRNSFEYFVSHHQMLKTRSACSIFSRQHQL